MTLTDLSVAAVGGLEEVGRMSEIIVVILVLWVAPPVVGQQSVCYSCFGFIIKGLLSVVALVWGP